MRACLRQRCCSSKFSAATGNIYSGLWYPIVVACMSLVVGFLFLPETKDVDITEH